MMETDACIHPLPAGDTSLTRMAIEARELGFGAIVVPGAEAGTYGGVRIIPALVLSIAESRRGAGGARKHEDNGRLVFADAGDYGQNRALLSRRGIHVIRGLHRTPKNSFDHISARLAAEYRIAVDLDLSPVVRERGSPRQKVLSRYRDLVRLHSRFSFPLTISSNAFSFLDLRSPGEICMICTLFDLDPEDSARALQTPGTLLAPPDPVRVVG